MSTSAIASTSTIAAMPATSRNVLFEVPDVGVPPLPAVALGAAALDAGAETDGAALGSRDASVRTV
jgi:hypothetical protein